MAGVARKRPLTWAEVGFLNAGIRGASRGLKFALGWAIVTADLGREPESVEEYAEVLDESRATAFRDQQAFRKAFPTEETPTRMVQTSGMQDRMNEVVRRVKDSRKAAIEAQPLIFSLGASQALAG